MVWEGVLSFQWKVSDKEMTASWKLPLVPKHPRGSAAFANDIPSWLHPRPDGKADGTGKNTDSRIFTASFSPPPLPGKEDVVRPSYMLEPFLCII